MALNVNLESKKKSNRVYWLIAGLFLLVAAGGSYLWVNQAQITERGTYQTSTATLGTLTANVGATGTIRAGHSAILVWNTSGRVEIVNAGLGTKIKTDQVLAALSPDSVSKNIILAEADLVTAQKNLDTLLLSNSTESLAMQKLADAKQTVSDAQDKYDFITQERVPGEVIQDASDQIVKAKKQLKQLEFFYNLFYSNRPDGATDKALMIVQLTKSKQNIADLTSKYNWYTSQASPIEIEKTLAALNLAKAKQEDAQRALDRLKNGGKLADITAAKARVAAATATINQAQIVAPFDGTVTQSTIQAGDRVSTGQTAFRVDDLTLLMVDLQISEVDINNVAVGQAVTVSMDAVPDKTYQGIVSKVNQSAKAGQVGINFTVSVTLTDNDELVKPGMTADVTIIVKQVADALLVPNRAVRMVSGKRIVYILKDKQPLPVAIRLGASADENSQVIGGDLKAGDLIILNPPNAANPDAQSASPTLTPVK
ncbi:MAG: efflux RND transporter periplasmic adaptor subunit [Chloroflexi bacterium]|nr:efflux RND transporter periplasmic adaptor subunit [Chloroflexota bacterium]